MDREKGNEELREAAPEAGEQLLAASPETIETVREELPDDEVLYDLAELFKVFGDSTRIRILYAMFRQEMNVTDLCEALGLSISAISHQLRLLKQAKLVRSRRDGRMVYYMLADEHVKTIIGMAKEHIEE